ncbi:MAG: AMP-binding protein [Chitinophagales bacterium]
MNSQKLWYKNYPENIPHEINADRYENAVALLDESFTRFANNPAYTCMGKTYTYKQIDESANAFGAYLQKNLALQAGDRIAIMMPNLLQYPVVLFGAMRAGLIVVNTNPLYTPREMEHQFNDAGVKAIVILENFATNLQEIIHNTGIKHIILTGIGDMLGFPKKMIVNFAVRHVKKMVPAYKLPNVIRFNDALRAGGQLKVNKHKAKSDDIACLQYTGGTTGVSKGAMLTHRNIMSNMEMISAWMYSQKDFLNEGKEIVITALPLYHIFAFVVNCLATVKHGGHSILITNPRDMDSFIKDLKKYPFSLMTGVNTLFNGLLNQPEFQNVDFSHLKVTVGGGMAVQKVVAEKWEKVTGCPLIEGYGLTEASPVLTVNPIGAGRIGTIGLPVPSTDIRIVDDAGNDVALGERGEIIGAGPQIMKGYWKREAATADVIKDGWLYTGDIGVMDEDGFIKIVDRKKDMILVSGFNVYPNEIEDVIASHDGVLEVACIGVPDEKSGEAVKVFVVKKDQNLTEQDLRDYCAEHLTGYKKPRHYAFKDDLPKSNVGKILRRKLKDMENQ